MSKLEKEFQEFIEDDAFVSVVFSMAQDLVQDPTLEADEAQALNIIVGSSFALVHAINNYKEIKNGKSINYCGRA